MEYFKEKNDLNLSSNDTLIILKKDDLSFLKTEQVYNVLFPNENNDLIDTKISSKEYTLCPGIRELNEYLRLLRTSSSKKHSLLFSMLKEISIRRTK